MSQRSRPVQSPRAYRPDFDGLDRAEIARRYGRAAAYREDSEANTAFWLRLLALLLVLSLIVMLAAYTLSRVTSRDAARRILGRAIPEITDFDGTLSSHYDELQSAASSPAGANGFTLTGYPIKAALFPQDVLNRSPSEVRQALLTRSADVVYDRGTGAFTASGKPVQLGSFTLLSAPWAFNGALNLLNPSFHARATTVAKAALIAVVVLSLLLLPLSRGYNQLVLYGAALLIASLPLLVLSGIAWLAVQLAYGTSVDPLVAGTSDLARDVCWFVVLSYLVYAALALAIIILGLLF
ncbi:MAG TPA: hypothetical protein VH916_10685, partial [Dehalococcoidia bacterium]